MANVVVSICFNICINNKLNFKTYPRQHLGVTMRPCPRGNLHTASRIQSAKKPRLFTNVSPFKTCK